MFIIRGNKMKKQTMITIIVIAIIAIIAIVGVIIVKNNNNTTIGAYGKFENNQFIWYAGYSGNGSLSYDERCQFNTKGKSYYYLAIG